MSGQSHKKRWLLAGFAGVAALVGGVFARRRGRAAASASDEPADVGFMRALHAALRRDLSRLEAVAAQVDGTPAPPEVLAGWDAFRAQLDNHHTAEDDDLWPVLRAELTDTRDLDAVNEMITEHAQIPAALDAVDAALRRGDDDLSAAVQRLSTVVRDHLAHEERDVLPLVERHLTRAQWRAFLITERNRRSMRERPEFLTWVLDEADERDAAAVLRELPPPARVVYRRVLRPRYQARHLWRVSRPEVGAGASGRDAGGAADAE